jgi:hypothetical protein
MSKALLPHQIEDGQFLADRNFSGNFSGMGSGKTLTALEAFRHVKSLVTDQVIIIGPPISLHMWASEFEAYFPDDTAQVVKTGKTKIDGAAAAIVMSYDIARAKIDELKALGARALICDESHALKNPEGKTAQAILGPGGLASFVDHAWMLTGTPTTRWNDDLYTFLLRADPQGMKVRVGGTSLSRFRMKYCVMQAKKFSARQYYPTMVTVGNRNTEELNDWIFGEGLAVRRELKDVWAAMPPLTINGLTIAMKMNPELSKALKLFDKLPPRELEEEVSKGGENLATIRRMIGQSKVPASAAEIADRVDSGAGALLVGAWHIDVIDDLVANMKGRGLRCESLDGRTSAQDKQRLQDAFNEGDLDVLVGQIKAMGVSLNLQHGGNRIIVVEEDWSPSVMDQFFARLHRMGQQDHVHVDVLRGENKIEEAVARISNTKRAEHKRAMKQEEKV